MYFFLSTCSPHPQLCMSQKQDEKKCPSAVKFECFGNGGLNNFKIYRTEMHLKSLAAYEM